MSFDILEKELKAQKYRPIYFLHGEETYFIDQIDELIMQNALSEDDKAFNLHVYYGKDSTMAQVLSAAKQYPVMAERQVVMLREAQEYKKEEFELLMPYLNNPVSSTLLYIAYKGKLDERTKFSKVLKDKNIGVKAEKMYDDKLPAFIQSYLGVKAFTISPEAAQLVADSIGNDLQRISNELDKMMINMGTARQVSVKNVEDNIGISKEFNVFELQKALALRNVEKVYTITNYMMGNIKKVPLLVIIGGLYPFFSKLLCYVVLGEAEKRDAAKLLGINPYFIKDYTTAARFYPFEKVKQVIAVLHEYDIKSKGVGIGPEMENEQLLREMVFKILH